MENASKALIMAGSVLIALLIIGALLLMFNNLSSYQETDTQSTKEAQVIEFNNQYETYNRKNVRGSELYSLMNRVVDYNKRKSTKGTGKNEEGQYLAYAPMTIEVDLKGKKQDFYAPITSSYTHLIKDKYSIDETNNDFEKNFYSKIKEHEQSIGEDVLNNLVAGFENIFNNLDKEEAVRNFNSACKSEKVTSIEQINDQYREKVCQYYEYVSFKRARFDCITNNTTYDSKTGRITKMKFEFNGEFE